MSGYLPGQTYVGRDGDRLFVILGEDGIAFVTNRGTRVTLAEAERVYAPLTPATGGALSPEVSELLELIHAALDLPLSAATHDDIGKRQQLRNDNAVRVLCSVERVLDGGAPAVACEVRVLRKLLADNPVDYVTRDEEAPSAAVGTTDGEGRIR